MKVNKVRWIRHLGVGLLCLVTLSFCSKPGEPGKGAPETAASWTLTVSAAVDHLDLIAREPMIVEHPGGSLFVTGYGAAFMSGKEVDVPPLWKSSDGGTTWSRVNVGTMKDGAVGNSDPDLAVAPDGTLYFAVLVFNSKAMEGEQINIGASPDGGATWKWTQVSRTRFDDRPWIEVTPDGTAHVIWNDGAGVCYAVSKDRGLTWTERERIHPKGGSSHLAVGPNGEIAVRIIPVSASGSKYDEGVDLIAVSTDAGLTWTKHDAPGDREWNHLSDFPVPRWVEPLAWDAGGALYSFWTNLKGIWLARSPDRGATWTTWRLRECPEVAYYPYLVARGRGELAATWFAGWTGTWHARVARIDVGEGEVPPRMAESAPFRPDSWQRPNPQWPDDRLLPDPAGEYVPVLFLRDGGLAVVSTIQDMREKRFGFSFRKVENHGKDLPRTNESLSKPDLADVVREHVAAVNNDDIDKNLTFFTHDAIIEMGAGARLSGKEQLRNLMESDAVNKARLTILDMKVKGNTVIARLTGKNEFLGLLGVEESPQQCTYEFRGRFLEKVTVEFVEGGGFFDEKNQLFAEWAGREHPLEFKKMEEGGFTAERMRLLLALAKEWRDQTFTETVRAEQELIKLENEWAEAWIKRDVAFQERIVTDDYTWTSPWGEVSTKADSLSLVRFGQDVVHAWVLDDMKVRVYGNAAVVTGSATIKETYKGEDVSGQEQWTHTWVRLAGHWQCVAAHSSEIAQK